jgi:hypothetical protein
LAGIVSRDPSPFITGIPMAIGTATADANGNVKVEGKIPQTPLLPGHFHSPANYFQCQDWNAQ